MNEKDMWMYYVAFKYSANGSGDTVDADVFHTRYAISEVADIQKLAETIAAHLVAGTEVRVLSWTLLSPPMRTEDPRESEAKVAALRQMANKLDGIPPFGLPAIGS